MTQIALGIAVGMIKSDKGDCWYCKEKPKSDNLKNDEDADPDTSTAETVDAVPENDEKNDATKLGTNLGNKPSWVISCPDRNIDTVVLSAAHHCIPGNAAFKNATTLHRFIRKGGKLKLSSDIGYSINHENNGVWLPGNYNVRVGKEGYTDTWGKMKGKFKESYSERAMDKARVQFHDAHSDYNKNVLQTLKKVAGKIGKPTDICPFCGSDLEEARPPYGLVGRLDFVSRQHKRMITSIHAKQKKKKKYVKAGYYTSSMVKKYFKLV